MMKRLVAALAALVIASTPVQAGRVLVIKANSQDSNTATNASTRYQAMVTGVLDALGVDYDVVPQGMVAATTTSNPGNLNQNALRTGTVYLNNGPNSPSRQYAAIIHMGFHASSTGGAVDVSKNRTTGYNPDTLTRVAAWPVIPQVFFGPARLYNNGLYATTSTCSTGVSGSNGAWLGNRYISVHSPGYDEVFRTGTTAGMFQWYGVGGAAAGVAVKNAGYTDRVVKNRLSLSTSNTMALGTAGADSSIANPDGLPNGRPATYFSPLGDTCVVWTIERHTNFRRNIRGSIISTPDSAMLIFATPVYPTNGGTDTPSSIVAMSIAMLDSACFGGIIGQKPGWRPKKIAFVVSGAFTRSTSYGHGPSAKSHGVVLDDSLLIKAGIDSLASLGVPVTVTLDPDSVTASKAYEKFWWSRLPGVRYGYEPAVALDTLLTGAAVLADSLISPDPFGLRRSRTISNAAVLGGGDCGTTDTSMVCLLKRSRLRMTAIPEFSGKIGGFLLSSWDDYIPSNYNRATFSGDDSLASVFLAAGFSCGGLDAARLSDMTSTKLTATGSVAVGSAYVGAPGFSFFRQRTSRSTLASGKTFNWLCFRAFDEDVAGNAFQNHDMANEFLNGLFMNNWYPANLEMRNHEFKTPLSLFVVRPGDLGCTLPGGSQMMPGFFQVKWITNQIRLINKFAGRTVVSITYPEDVEP